MLRRASSRRSIPHRGSASTERQRSAARHISAWLRPCWPASRPLNPASVRRWRRWGSWRRRWRRGGLGRHRWRGFRRDARRRWWRWRYELAARPPQPCREYPAGKPVERHDRPVATSGTAEVYVPAGVPVEMGVVGVVDDEPARARVLRRDGHCFRRRQDSRRRRAWSCLHDAGADQQQQNAESSSHA